MEKARGYPGKFSSRIIRRAIDRCVEINGGKKYDLPLCSVTIPGEQWSFDTIDEFLSSYSGSNVLASQLLVYWSADDGNFSLQFENGRTTIRIASNSRSKIEEVSSIFAEASSDDIVKATPPPKSKISIFIGHGRDPEWVKLKSHLQDKHKLEVLSYETGARAGHTIRDILQSMSEKSSFALLVLTGEDKAEDGIRARQNVIHECGLFQGKLGFDRAILLVEDGVELASNFDGIQQLRFAKERIAETFGDVIATLRREFGPM
jgi:predicted nucleotide-binding protein